MDLGLLGKTAVVAASSRGLGFAAALELAREGANVVLCGRQAKNIERAAENINKETGRVALACVADVSCEPDIQNLVQTAVDKLNRIDILVTNAGGPPPGNFSDFNNEEDWHQAFQLTFMSANRLIRYVLPYMKKQKWGRIVNIVSISVKQPLAGLLLSNTFRPAVIGMAKSLSDEVAGEGITINNVCPGWTKTERVDELLSLTAEKLGISIAEATSQIEQNIPMKRMGRPEELAALITFLCSERAGYITGTTIQVDGGTYRGLM